MCDVTARMALVRACNGLHKVQRSSSRGGEIGGVWRERDALRSLQSAHVRVPEEGLAGGGRYNFNHLCELSLRRPYLIPDPDPEIPLLSAAPPMAEGREALSAISDGATGVVKALVGRHGWTLGNNNASALHIREPSVGGTAARVARCTPAEVDDAFAACASAKPLWEQTALSERALCLRNAADRVSEHFSALAQRLTSEIAKPPTEAAAEVERTVSLLRYTAEEGLRSLSRNESVLSDGYYGHSRSKLSIESRVPLGRSAVVCIAPPNFPINLAASKLAPALMAGNPCVLKPPTQGATASLLLARLLQLSLPVDGLLSALPGDPNEIGDHLVSNSNASLISFTGSTRAGEIISSQSGATPLSFELGGNDVAIVLDSANLDDAAKQIAKGCWTFSGQRCTATKLVVVHNQVADELLDRLEQQRGKLRVGSAHEGNDIVPLISPKQADRVAGYVEDAKSRGATGELVRNEEDPTLLQPCILDCTNCPDASIVSEEQFAPVLPVVRFESEEQALSFVNDNAYGLQGSLFTTDLDTAFRLSSMMRTGTVVINGAPSRGPDCFAFTGGGDSWVGDTQGIPYSLHTMSRLKTIVLQNPSGVMSVSK